ncbi:hypothetical protein HDU96_001617 [Phlyctochytrium bullatum]|nr:hypothetical protein HDU96_001617 [Phlyctochytrium bullatum]
MRKAPGSAKANRPKTAAGSSFRSIFNAPAIATGGTKDGVPLLSPESRSAVIHQKRDDSPRRLTRYDYLEQKLFGGASPSKSHRPRTAPSALHDGILHHSNRSSIATGGVGGHRSPVSSRRMSTSSKSGDPGGDGTGSASARSSVSTRDEGGSGAGKNEGGAGSGGEGGALGLAMDRRYEAERRKDIVIHVFDENRNAKRDFFCKRHLLLREMKYFSTYLTERNHGNQVEIDVHCDIEVFDWLMCFITRQKPTLEPRIAVSILISSNFLQMNGLEKVCLQYIHDNINEIVKVPIDMSCINKTLLSK